MQRPEGLCLSQLPLHLNEKLGYTFRQQDFGFVKVKELIENFSDMIEIKLHDKNHPFIFLKDEFKMKVLKT